MFRVTRYQMISKTESGQVGYRKKYWVAGRVRVPAGHCCHPVFQISKCQCNRGSFSVSYPHAFVSQAIVIIIAIWKVLRLISVNVLSQEYGEELCSSQDYFCDQRHGNDFVSYPKPQRVTEQKLIFSKVTAAIKGIETSAPHIRKRSYRLKAH